MSDTVGASLSPPGSINDSRTVAHLAIGQRLGTLDLSPILVNTVTGAPASALPFLAWQFDVLSPWWQLLAGPESQTAIIQNAVALHRYSGTVASIQNIMANLGFPIVTIQEGQDKWGGTQYPADEGWAVFRVLAAQYSGSAETYPSGWDTVSDIDTLTDIDALAEAADIVPISVALSIEQQAISAINFFKPQRSILDSLWFIAPPIQDEITVGDYVTIVAENYIQEAPIEIADFVTAPAWALADSKTTAPLYSGHFYHAGITYGASQPAVVDSGISIGGAPEE